MAYAIQWFLFAGVAAVIYLLALRKRGREATSLDLPKKG
jgi:surfeit locus 1 family protein